MSERSKLQLQAQQLSVELEQAREQIAIKNRETLRLHEENLSIEEQLREVTRTARQAQESLKGEQEMRGKLDHRYIGLLATTYFQLCNKSWLCANDCTLSMYGSL